MESLLYLATGLIAGLLSGLFGVGGGIVVVPVLAMIFAGLGFPPAHIMHLAIGTSLATIIVTSISSTRAHHRHANVDWQIVLWMAPTGMAGAVAAIWLVSRLHSNGLQLIFALFECAVAVHLFWGKMPQKHQAFASGVVLSALGSIVGFSSSLLGIGGGTISVPLLMYGTGNMRAAIGTSAALGLPLAIIGASGYLVAGLGQNGLPEASIGYLYLPAAGGIIVTGMLAAPLGVRLAQRLPISVLKKCFAVVLFLLGVKMGWEFI